jgi:hypothetical protein
MGGQQFRHVIACCLLSPKVRHASVAAVDVQAPDDEPVWRQLLLRYHNHSDPVVAQQAAAALAE